MNSVIAYPNMFVAEADGLRQISSTATVPVPVIIETGECDGYSYLLLEQIQCGAKKQAAMFTLGAQLALMHKHNSERFGFGTDNYIGSLPQQNTWKATWTEFFAECRLLPMVKITAHKQLLSAQDVAAFERLLPKLRSLFPSEPPALLHGDLWNGNYLIN